MRPAASATRCCGCQPVRAVADLEFFERRKEGMTGERIGGAAAAGEAVPLRGLDLLDRTQDAHAHVAF